MIPLPSFPYCRLPAHRRANRQACPKDPDTPPLRSCLGEGGLCEGGQANQDSLSLSNLSFSFLGTDKCARKVFGRAGLHIDFKLCAFSALFKTAAPPPNTCNGIALTRTGYAVVPGRNVLSSVASRVVPPLDAARTLVRFGFF